LNNNNTHNTPFTDGAILFYSSSNTNKRANAIFLICAWQILHLNRTPEEAYNGFKLSHEDDDDDDEHMMTSSNSNHSSTSRSNTSRSNTSRSRSNPPIYPLSTIGKDTIASLPAFHDASPYQCPYELTLLDCLTSLQKARQYNFFDWGLTLNLNNNSNTGSGGDNNNSDSNASCKFDINEYEYFEQVENGDLNWIVKGKICAFAGPSYQKYISPEGYCTLSPNDYIPYFQKRNIKLVVRLNKKNYNESDFINNGIQHFEQFYTDGSCPTMIILQRILSQFDSTGIPSQSQTTNGTGGTGTGTGAFAVHCKAGLGRTGTCIGAWLMKHYRLSAKDVIGWMRICRPGMVIGPQQQFLANIQSIMWQEGDMVRSLYPSNRVATNITTTRHSNDSNAVVVTPTRGKPSSSPTSVTVLSACNGKEDGHEVLLLGGEHEVHVGGDDPGQADRLLAARLKQNRQRHSQSQSQSQQPQSAFDNNDDESNKKKKPAVPVTPDNSNNNNDSSKKSVGAAQSLWARAFA